MFIYNNNDFNQAAVCVDDKLWDVCTMSNFMQIDCASQISHDYVKSCLMGWVFTLIFLGNYRQLLSYQYCVATISFRCVATISIRL